MFRIGRAVFLLLLGWLLAVRVFAAAGHEYVQSTKGDSLHWTALKWTQEDTALFGGAPEYHGADKHLILVRYLFYVSAYDVGYTSLCPDAVAGNLKPDISSIANLVKGDANPKVFLRQLATHIKPGTTSYAELHEDIFGA